MRTINPIKQQIKKVMMVAIASVLCFGITACGDKSWALKADSDTISSSAYTYNLMVAYHEAQTKLNEKGISTDDLKNESIEDKNAVTWIKDRALELSKGLIVIENMFKELGLELSEEEKNQAQNATDSIWEQFGDVYEKRYGINKDSINQAYSLFSIKKEKLFDGIYGKAGTNAVSDEELLDYYKNNYVAVKFYSKTPFEDNDEHEEESEQSEQSESQEGQESQGEKGQVDTNESIEKQFSEYVDALNNETKTVAEISDMIINADNLEEGSEALKTELVNLVSNDYPEIKEAVKTLDVGKATFIKYNDVYFFFYRDPSLNLEDLTDLSEEKDRKEILLEMKFKEFNEKISERIKNLDVKINEEAINQIDPEMFSKKE